MTITSPSRSSLSRSNSRSNSTQLRPASQILHVNESPPIPTELDDLAIDNGLRSLPHLPPYTNQLPQMSKQELRDHFQHRHHPYTNIGSKTLVVCNHKLDPSLYTSSVNNYYADVGYHHFSGENTTIPRPHIFQLATTAYLHLRRMGEHQTILFGGMVGSGKTFSYHQCLHQLALLGTCKSKRRNPLGHQLIQTHRVTQWIGQATTRYSYQSTRIGLYQELQFSRKGRLVGFKSLGYYLETSRITQPRSRESNFHAFYWLLDNHSQLDDQEINRLGLILDPQHYKYTMNSCANKTIRNQIEQLQDNHASELGIDGALKAVGIRRRARHHIYQLLAIILHLGNLEWTEHDGQLTIRDHQLLDLIGELCGVPSDSLESILTSRTRCIGGELCTMMLKLDEAYRQRDQLARTLYQLLFSWIIEAINAKCCYDSASDNLDDDGEIYFISLLDQPGFLPVQSSSNLSTYEPMLDELAINFINETLQDLAIDFHLSSDGGIYSEMQQEGLAVPEFQIFPLPRTTLHLLRGDQSHPFRERQGCIPLLETMSLEHQHHPRRHGTDNAAAHERLSWINPGQYTAMEIMGHFVDHPAFIPPPETQTRLSARFSQPINLHQFSIQHFWGPVTYYTEKTPSPDDQYQQFFLDDNGDAISPDIVSLFRSQCENPFLKDLFYHPLLTGQNHTSPQAPMITAQLPHQPLSLPSEKRRSGLDPFEASPSTNTLEKSSRAANSTLGQLNYSLETILKSLQDSTLRRVMHLRRSLSQNLPDFQLELFEWQLQNQHILPLIQASRPDWVISFSIDDMLSRYQSIFPIPIPRRHKSVTQDHGTKVHDFIRSKGWSERECLASSTRIFFTEMTWKDLEDSLRRSELAMKSVSKSTHLAESHDSNLSLNLASSSHTMHSGLNSKRKSGYQQLTGGINWGMSTTDRAVNASPANYPFHGSASHSEFGSEEELRGLWKGTPRIPVWSPEGTQYPTSTLDYSGSVETLNMVAADRARSFYINEKKPFVPPSMPVPSVSTSRLFWQWLTYTMTFFIPNWCLRCRGIKDPQVQSAWREKVTLCLLIFSLWGIVLMVNIGLGPLICPKGNDFSLSELSRHNTIEDNYVGIRGVVYDISHFSQSDHGGSGASAGPTQMLDLAGQELTSSFPIALAAACPTLVDDLDLHFKHNATFTGFIHTPDPEATYAETTRLSRPNWYYEVALPGLRLMKRGHLSYTWEDLENGIKGGMRWGVIDNNIYDLTPLFLTVEGMSDANSTQYHFLDPSVEKLFSLVNSQVDLSGLWNQLPLTPLAKDIHLRCLKNAFYAGRVDPRPTARCLVTDYLLFGAAWMMLLVIVVKLVASLQLGMKRAPHQPAKFVICQVPCYTEGEDSLRRTLESLASLDYPDGCKLLFIVADGMIIGSGNDRPTPKIVLDVLGVDTSINDPAPQSFISLGSGNRQHNMGKVYSGLYNHAGHQVPFIFVSKVGLPDERARPGNRGKRDSQVLLLRFLNRVHKDSAMAPLELDIYHHLTNVIGISPSHYEYILMVDADTQVATDALTRLVACMSRDSKIVGICGETHLANPNQSWATMIQVYEYFISHHMSKAFESLFGSVTCLPGCFCLYRIRSPLKKHHEGGPILARPLIIADSILHPYSENQVDTLHLKNLLSLGEDRYLTTLIMKNFPEYKLHFTPDAKCWTAAPESWSVLLSQRRRWINSTIHNLAELLTITQLCGFCCLSLRMIVFVDLFGTLVMPAMVVYLSYLFFVLITHPFSQLGLVTVILLGAIYGSQILLFVIKRKWSHCGWMVIHTLALPIFQFMLPVYAFWHFDDFSWGNTRLALGGGMDSLEPEEDFDPKSIPHITWSQYQVNYHPAHLLPPSTSTIIPTAYPTWSSPPEQPSQPVDAISPPPVARILSTGSLSHVVFPNLLSTVASQPLLSPHYLPSALSPRASQSQPMLSPNMLSPRASQSQQMFSHAMLSQAAQSQPMLSPTMLSPRASQSQQMFSHTMLSPQASQSQPFLSPTMLSPRASQSQQMFSQPDFYSNFGP